MRIRNKELNQRWHRKEQRIKELKREAIAGAADKPKSAPKPKPAAKKVEAEAKPKKAAAPKAEAEAKPKKAPAKKKVEEAPVEATAEVVAEATPEAPAPE